MRAARSAGLSTATSANAGATCRAKTSSSASAAVWLDDAARNSGRNGPSGPHTSTNIGNITSATSSGATPDRSGGEMSRRDTAPKRPSLFPK